MVQKIKYIFHFPYIFILTFTAGSNTPKPTKSERQSILELLHCRRKKSSTIFCSQFEFEEWYDQLGGSEEPLADAILDRIAHDSYRINIKSIDPEHDISMREIYGLDKSLRE